MEVRFYTLNKRVNSTKKPAAGSAVQTYTGKLREPSGIINPSIGFDLGHNTSPAVYNYAYIPLFNRFYYVSDWTWEEGLWYAQLQVDALASWRDGIRSSMQYVLRSSDQTLWNGQIIDSMYPCKADPSGGSVLVATPWAGITNITSGYYVVGVVNSDSNAVGATSYYVFGNTGFRTFMNALLSDVTWTGFTDGDSDLTEPVYKSLFNPMQYITSCMWCPMSPNTTGDPLGSITVGWWTVNAPCTRLGNPVITTTTTASLANLTHPQAATRGVYLNSEPYTRLSINVPPYGKFPLSAMHCLDKGSIDIVSNVDVISGIGDLHINAYDREVVTSCQFCVPVQLAQIAQNFTGAASSAIGSVTGALVDAITGQLGSAITGAATGLVNAAECLLPQVQTSGVNGCFSGFRGATVDATWLSLVDEDRQQLGRPLCSPVVLSAFTTGSYVKILEPDISLAATAAELDTIREYLAAGIFLD